MFSKQGKQLGELLLKYHRKSKQTKKQTQPTQLQEISNLSSQPNPRDNKYSNDYSQFQKIADKIEPDTKQTADIKQPQPSSNPTQYFAHTHDKRKQRELYERSTQQKLQNAQYFKNQGNKAYSDQQYQKASYCYQKALVHFDYTFPENEKQQNIMKQLQQKCHQNMGLCLYKLHNKDQATFHLKQTLKYNQTNIKALYSLAKISLDSDDYQRCQYYIGEVKHVSPNNKQIQTVILQLSRKRQKYSQKTKKMSQMMLAK